MLIAVALMATFVITPCPAFAESDQTTRISDATQHHRKGPRKYPYREKSDYILNELDLKEGDVIVDVGAGSGFWAAQFAECVGESGVVHAAEIKKTIVDKLNARFEKTPQVKPYLAEPMSTGLPENSCDVAFLSQTYHHLNTDGHIEYLKHLRKVIKPTGRVVIVEKYTEIGLSPGEQHGTRLSRLVRQSEEAGWVPVRLELMTGTYHYIAILAQKELFPPEPSLPLGQLKKFAEGLMQSFTKEK
jgi:ubiquinone/menaquinone biosynthesis C-methylase UbiE